MTQALREFLLAFADDELCMGHRHSEWLGVAPFLEEDLAFASIGQDELGHARALYGLVADAESVDVTAFERTNDEFRSAHIVELPCRSWEDALARHFLYDVAEMIRWGNVDGSTHAGLAGIADRAIREERYHVAHAESLVVRMLSSTEQAHERVGGSITALFPQARALFEPTVGEDELVSERVIGAPASELESIWVAQVLRKLATVGFVLDPSMPVAGSGGRTGRRSEYFAELWATMTAVSAIDPAASW